MTHTRSASTHIWWAKSWTPLTVVLLGAIACSDGTPELLAPDELAGFEQSSRIHVTNNLGMLQRRVRMQEGQLRIVPVPGPVVTAPGAGGLAPEPDDEVMLILRAEVDPPDLGGMTIQATHIALDAGVAYVSYNVQGPVYRGGVDAFDVRDVSQPTLISQALFDDTDISALDERSGSLYLATATSEPSFSSPAVLEEVRLDHGRLTSLSRRVDLPSYAATGVDTKGDQILVTSGDGADGGLSIFGRKALDLETIVNFRDARAVMVDGDLAIAMKGTPGGLYVVERKSGLLLDTWEPGGANIPESKSTIDIYHDYVLMAAGDEGLKVVSLEHGQTVAHHPVPEIDGLAPGNSVTNAVTRSKDLVFLANGGAGLYVVEIDEDDEEPGVTLELVGKVEFLDGPSVNYVAAEGNILFVAAGDGGLKIIEIVEVEDEDDGE